MKITYSKLLDLQDALRSLSKNQYHAKQAIALARLIKRVDAEMELFDAQRLKICQTYGELDEQGADFKIPNLQRAEFAAAINDLLAVDVDIDGEPIALTADFVTADTILKTDGFIVFDQEG